MASAGIAAQLAVGLSSVLAGSWEAAEGGPSVATPVQRGSACTDAPPCLAGTRETTQQALRCTCFATCLQTVCYRLVPQARETTRDGFEAHLGTNHLAHFLLTLLLLPSLRLAAEQVRPAASCVPGSSASCAPALMCLRNQS